MSLFIAPETPAPMSLATTTSPTGSTGASPGAPFWTAGTLRYTKGALVVLFLWLLGNDLCLMLMEQVAPTLTPLLLKAHGASNRDIALYISTFGGAFTIWINPRGQHLVRSPSRPLWPAPSLPLFRRPGLRDLSRGHSLCSPSGHFARP